MKQKLKTPYLVQRGTINKPLADNNTRLSRAVDLDFMGSSEFEWGALPKSFRALQAEADQVILRQFPAIQENGIALRVYSALDDQQFEEYGKFLLRMRGNSLGGNLHLKERASFDPNERLSFEKVDFWWDIQNHVMWGFHKQFMKRLGEYVANSIIYMDQQKEQDKQ